MDRIAVKQALMNLALCEVSTKEEKDKLYRVIEEFRNSGPPILESDWRHQRLLAQIKRYMSGIERSKKGRPTRYMLCTQMKSATKHIENCLRSVYSLERFTPPFDFSSVEQSADRLKPVFYNESDYVFGDSFLSYHLYPGKDLIMGSIQMDIPIIVLIRNPAQAMVSHYYYGLKNGINSKTTLTPGEYFGPCKIKSDNDWKKFLVKKTLPRTCAFIDRWLEVIDSLTKQGVNSVKVFLYEDMIHKKEAFYEELNDYVGIKFPNKEPDHTTFENIKNHNQRRGRTDEWKEFFFGEDLREVNENLSRLKNKHEILRERWIDL